MSVIGAGWECKEWQGLGSFHQGIDDSLATRLRAASHTRRLEGQRSTGKIIGKVLLTTA